jgi:hypothetical protein
MSVNRPAKKDRNLEFEQMLEQPLFIPPPGFEQRLLARQANMQPVAVATVVVAVARTDTPAQLSGMATSGELMSKYLMKPLRYLALLGGGAFAFSELIAFMFGLWTVSTAF